MILGRDVAVGVDPAVAVLIWAAFALATVGLVWALFYALLRQLGWTDQ